MRLRDISPDTARLRSRVAALKRHRPPDDPDIAVAEVELLVELTADRLRVLDGADLTAAQRLRLITMLAEGGDGP